MAEPFRRIICYMAEPFRRIICYMAELFRRFTCYTAEPRDLFILSKPNNAPREIA